ncbi:unnamed protein product [Victoria cruziana]
MERCPFDGRSALVFYRTLDRSPSSTFGFWVARFLRVFACGTGCLSRNSSIVIRSFASGNVRKEGSSGLRRYPIMDGLVEKKAEAEERRGMSESNGSDEFREGGSSCESSTTYCGTSEEQSCSEESLPIGWPIGKAEARSGSVGLGAGEKAETRASSEKREKTDEKFSEIEMMKERFSKLLLGEDMSGSGKGVSTALAISNAITNLCATIFGQLWRLEPLSPEKKSMWRREMEWLVCVSDHIVELIPSWQTFPDGTKLEVMTCRPRSDLYINLPALKKLDNMLLEILDSFSDTEFWYVDQGIVAPDDNSVSYPRSGRRQEEKWWLPVPRVPPCGLHEKSRKELQHKRECTNQILKAAMAINSNALSEMEIPESYLESLPKNGRSSLGDVIHRYITSDQFSPECLLDCLDLSSEHQALEIANRVEASIYVWRRRTGTRPAATTNRSNSRSSWDMVRDLMLDADKRELLAGRAESLLLCLKQRFPGLSQTSLDMSKIQYNKDVGQSILESYSRVLESLSFNIIARIDDVLYVDDMTKHADQYSSVPTVSVLTHKKVSLPYSVPVSSTPYATAFTTPSFSPVPLISPAKGSNSPFIHNKVPSRGFGVKKVLTDYLGVDAKGKNNPVDVPNTNSKNENAGSRKETVGPTSRD